MWYVYDRGCKIKHIRRSTVFNIANYEKQTAVTLRRVSVSYMGKIDQCMFFDMISKYINLRLRPPSISIYALFRSTKKRNLTHQKAIIVDLVAISASWSDLKFLLISNCMVFFSFFIWDYMYIYIILNI